MNERISSGLEMSTTSPKEEITAMLMSESGNVEEKTTLSLNLPLVYTVLEACVAISAVFGNLLVIVVFLQDKRLRKVTNFYIISLSLADLLVGAIGIPSAILTRLGMPHNSIRLCITMLSLLVVLCTISILNLVAVSLDRYWAILHPLDYHKRISEKTALAIICICWIMGSVIGFLPLFGWNNGHLAGEACFFIPIMNYNFLMFLYFVTIVLPAVVMAFFYIRIYMVVVQQLSLNKVRQLNTKEYSLPKVKGQSELCKLSQCTHNGNKESPHSPHRSKKYKSISSLQQSNKQPSSYIDDQDQVNRIVSSSTSGHNISGEGHSSSNEVPNSSLESLTLCSKKKNAPSPCYHMSNVRQSSDAMDGNHSVNEAKERRWKSMLSMRNFADTSLIAMTEERSAAHTKLTADSILSTFYRPDSSNKLSYSRREVKKAQKLFFIVVFFMLCWLPLYTSNTIQAFCYQCPTPSPVWLDFLIILSHINSAGSPFLYAFHMKDFRNALRRLVCKCAINKRQLRDLRREELFSISSRRFGGTEVIQPPSAKYSYEQRKAFHKAKSISEYYLCNNESSFTSEWPTKRKHHLHRRPKLVLEEYTPSKSPQNHFQIEVNVEHK